MFSYAAAFKESVYAWNVSNARNTEMMFYGARFYISIREWRISEETNMRNIFQKERKI